MAQYRLVRTLGSGGMGSVHLAIQEPLGREVALKLLPREAADDQQLVARFQREVKLISQLTHRNIVRIFDWGELDGQLFFAMEVVRGQDLTHEKSCDFPRACRLLVQAADALAYLHERQLYHRDVKPANFVVEPDGRLILIDFGLARTRETTMLTEEGAVVGTIRFVPPEALSGQSAEAAGDVYSLACTAHELLAGQPAMQGGSMPQLLAAILSADRPSLSYLPGIPPWFLDLQKRALALDPAARPTAAAYRDAVRDAAGPRRRASAGSPRPTSPTSVPPSSRRHLVRVFAVVSAVVLVSLLVVAARRVPPPEAVTAAATPAPRAVESASSDPDPSPAALAARTFTLHATERSLQLDFDVPRGARVVVEVARWSDRALQRRDERECADAFYQNEIQGLTADTDYAVRAHLADSRPLLADYHFRTLPFSHRAGLTSILEQLHVNPNTAAIGMDLLANEADPRAVPVLVDLLHRRPLSEFPAYTKIAILARNLKSRELAETLMARYDELRLDTERGDFLLAAVVARSPAAVQRAFELMPSATSPTMIEAGVRACMKRRGPAAHEAAARLFRAGRLPAPMAANLALMDRAAAMDLVRSIQKPLDLNQELGLTLLAAELADDAVVRVVDERRRDPAWTAHCAAEAEAVVNSPLAQQLLDSLTTPRLMPTALSALTRAGPFEPPDALLRLATADRPASRTAIAALVSSGSASAIPALLTALGTRRSAAPMAAWALSCLSDKIPPAALAELKGEVKALALTAADSSGLAAWAHAHFSGNAAAEDLAAALDAAPPGPRLIGLAWALTSCAPSFFAGRLRARAAAVLHDRSPDADPSHKALNRAAQLIERSTDLPPGTRSFLLPAEARAYRTGVEIASGQSFEVNAIGWWGPAGKPLYRIDEATWVQPAGVTAGAIAVVRHTTWGLTRKHTRLLVSRGGPLCFSPWLGVPIPDYIVDHPAIEGSALITISP